MLPTCLHAHPQAGPDGGVRWEKERGFRTCRKPRACYLSLSRGVELMEMLAVTKPAATPTSSATAMMDTTVPMKDISGLHNVGILLSHEWQSTTTARWSWNLLYSFATSDLAYFS